MIEKFEGEKRKQTIILGAVIGISFLGLFLLSNLFSSSSNKQVKKEIPKIKIVGEKTEELPFKKVYGDKLNELEAQMDELKKELKMMNELIKKQNQIQPSDIPYKLTGEYQIKTNPKEEQQRLKGPKIVSSFNEAPQVTIPNSSFNNNINKSNTTQPIKEKISVQVLDDLIVLEGNPVEANNLKSVSQTNAQPNDENNIKKSKKEKNKTIKDTIPAGSFVRAVLLSGLDAPTSGSATRNPHPVLFKLIDKVILPNKWRINIKDCFIIGTGYGDLSSERAYIRLERLSCTKNDGDIISKTVEGYVSGEDGKNGLKGRVVSKQGQLLARTLVAGFLQGVSQAFSYSQQTLLINPQGAVQTVNPNQALQYAGISGISEATKKLADFYMNLVNKTFPVIEILPGRKVDIVFLKDVNLED